MNIIKVNINFEEFENFFPGYSLVYSYISGPKKDIDLCFSLTFVYICYLFGHATINV